MAWYRGQCATFSVQIGVFSNSFIKVLFWLLSKDRGPVRSWPRGLVTTTRLRLTLRGRLTSCWFDAAPDEVAYVVTGMIDLFSELYPERVFSNSDGHRPSENCAELYMTL